MRAKKFKSLVSGGIFSARFSREKNFFANNAQREAHHVSLHVASSDGFFCSRRNSNTCIS
jgi:hypothetical protein